MKFDHYSPEVKKLLRHLIVLYDEIEVLELTDKKRPDYDDTLAAIRVLSRRCDEIRALLTNKDYQ